MVAFSTQARWVFLVGVVIAASYVIWVDASQESETNNGNKGKDLASWFSAENDKWGYRLPLFLPKGHTFEGIKQCQLAASSTQVKYMHERNCKSGGGSGGTDAGKRSAAEQKQLEEEALRVANEAKAAADAEAQLEASKREAAVKQDEKRQKAEKAASLADKAKELLNKGKDKLLEKGKEIGKKVLDKGKEIGKKVLEKGKELGKKVLNKGKEALGKLFGKKDDKKKDDKKKDDKKGDKKDDKKDDKSKKPGQGGGNVSVSLPMKGICTIEPNGSGQCLQDGAKPRGVHGILIKKANLKSSPFQKGANFNKEWDWAHLTVCCNTQPKADVGDSFYVFAKSCPAGVRPVQVGVILKKAKYNLNPFGAGGDFNNEWKWSHPFACEVNKNTLSKFAGVEVCGFASDANNCPTGWTSKGASGLIVRNSDKAKSFAAGAKFNNEWAWSHPLLCCHKATGSKADNANKENEKNDKKGNGKVPNNKDTKNGKQNNNKNDKNGKPNQNNKQGKNQNQNQNKNQQQQGPNGGRKNDKNNKNQQQQQQQQRQQNQQNKNDKKQEKQQQKQQQQQQQRQGQNNKNNNNQGRQNNNNNNNNNQGRQNNNNNNNNQGRQNNNNNNNNNNQGRQNNNNKNNNNQGRQNSSRAGPNQQQNRNGNNLREK